MYISDTTYLLRYISTIGGFLHENISGNTSFPECNKTVKLRTKTRSKQRVLVKVGLKYYDMESGFFYFRNCVGVVASQSHDTIPEKCVLEKDADRFFIGQEAFPGWEVVMLLSFSDTTITLFDPDSENDTEGFVSLKSLNLCRGNTLYLTVDSIEYDFLFHTGSSGFLSLPQYEKHKKDGDVSVASYRRRSVIDTLIVQQTNAYQ